jgi:hypothetical protein
LVFFIIYTKLDIFEWKIFYFYFIY